MEVAQKARDLRPEWDEPYLRLGDIYQKRGEGSLALEMFDKALEIRSSVEGWCGRGNVFQARGFIDSAEVAYRRAAKDNPAHDRPLYELGKLYYYSRDNLREAESLLRRAIEVRPDRGRSYEELAYLIEDLGNLQEGEELLRSYADRYPYHYDAYRILYDWLAWQKADAAAALAVIKEATVRNPDRVWPHLQLASAYAAGLEQHPEPEKCVAAIQKALQLRPRSGRTLRAAGYVYRMQGDMKKALHYYRLALEANPGSPQVLYHMGHTLLLQARFDSAAVVAAEGIRQAPGIVYGWNNYWGLGTALTHLMRPGEFLTVLQGAADKYGEENPMFYVMLGREQCYSNQYPEAMRSLDRSLQAREDGSAQYRTTTQRWTGMVLWLSGDTEGALASFRKSLSGSDLYLSGLPMIALLRYLGKFDEIEEQLEAMRDRGAIDKWVWHSVRYYPDMRRFDKALSVVAAVREDERVTYKTDLELMTAGWYRQKGDLGNAERVLKEIEPSMPSYYRAEHDWEWMAIETAKGDLERAAQFAKKAYEESAGIFGRNKYLTPLSKLYYAQSRTEDALNVIARADGFDENIPAFYQRAQMAIVTRSQDADEELRRALLLAERGARGEGRLGWNLGEARAYCALAAARLGDSQKARNEIEYAVQLEPERADIAYGAACGYALVGDKEKAFEWLQTAVERGHQELWWARVDPDLDPVREEPRFKEIMEDWDTRMRAMVD